MRDFIKIAGVTFENSDGENRQSILQSLGFGFFSASLIQTTFENERAVEVWVNGKQVGYIPRTELNNPMSFRQNLAVQVLYYEEKGIYYGELTEFQPVDKNTETEMQQYCQMHNIEMPVNDRRAYDFIRFKYDNMPDTVSK